MKSKIILNILVVYFLILSLVLLMQLSYKETNAVEPLSTNITTEEKLKNAVVLAINSPVVIIDKKQFLIDENDSTLVPIIEDGKVYIPAKLLKTTFGADIKFSKQSKETIIRLDNKAIIFSNNGTSIKIIDNVSEEIINVNQEAKIINDRFYIPLRTFAEIFDKEIFYNNDLIIISSIENLFDPIEEINILQDLEKQVKQLPIIGNEDNLKYILKTKLDYEKTKLDLLNIQNLTNMLEENKPIIIKKTNNYNIYATKDFIEVYFVTQDKKEIFSFKVDKINNNIKDIQITNDRFIVSYLDINFKTIIYNILDRENVKAMKIVEQNGEFYKNIIEDNNLYIMSTIDAYENKNKLPHFIEHTYENNAIVKTKEEKFTLDNIFYFPDMNDNKYTLVSYINLYDLDEQLCSNVYLGMGKNICINEDTMYVLTTNGDNNNLYQFKATLDGIKYIERQFIKGEAKDLQIDKEKQFIKIILKDNVIYYDDRLIKREV